MADHNQLNGDCGKKIPFADILFYFQAVNVGIVWLNIQTAAEKHLK